MTSPWQPPEQPPSAPPPGYQPPRYQQPSYVVATPQKRGAKTWVWVTIVVSVVVLLLAICAVAAWLGLSKLGEISREPFPTDPYPEASPRIAVHQIKLSVTGSGTAKINWATSGNLFDNKTTTLPWSTVGTTRQDFVRSQVSASGKGEMGCAIEIDGAVVAKEKGTGSVTCFFEDYLNDLPHA